MLAVATTFAAGCSHETAASSVTLPPQATTSGSGAASSASTTQRTGGTPTMSAQGPAGVDAGQQAALVQHPQMGSDPVPPPMPFYCGRVDAGTKASAVLKRNGKSVELELTVTLPTTPQATFVAPPSGSGRPAVSGGTVVSSHFTSTTAVVRVRPGPENLNGPIYLNQAFLMTVDFDLSCTGGRGAMAVSATFIYPPQDGASVTIRSIQSR